MSVRVTSLRMPESMADDLAVLARLAGEPVSEVIRMAIEKEIDARRADPSFQAQRKELLEKDVESLRRLSPPENSK